MPHTFRLTHISGLSLLSATPALFFAGLIILICLVPSFADASVSNHLQRIDIRPKERYTRIAIKLASEPEYTLKKLPDNRIRLYLHKTDGPLFKYLRRYSDRNIGGLLISQHGNDLVITFAVAPKGVGWRTVHLDGLSVINIDVGPLLASGSALPTPQPGRERIMSGAEKLLRDFDPPVKSDIPFVPTDRQVLKTILDEAEQKIFLAAEGELYKGKMTSAEQIFESFASRKGTPIRSLALYRLAETRYGLQKYSEALATFREAVQIWPDFLTFNPSSMFYYGDSIARSGDLPGGRQMLSRLIVAHADRKYAPVLLVRMADVLARQGNEPGAVAVYRTVAGAFKDNKASQIARMKLADRSFFEVTPQTYKPLMDTYLDVASRAGDYGLRNEATFKAVLLNAINGQAMSALEDVVKYQKRFPKSVYATIIKDIREDLVEQAYRQGSWGKSPKELIDLVSSNQEYLAGAIKVSGFLPSVSSAYEKAGRPIELIALYVGLLDRPWVGESNMPYLYIQIAEQAELLGDTIMAKKMLRGFTSRFPASPEIRIVREKLGAINYMDGEMEEVRSNLLWILNKNEHASLSASYYYLGRSLWIGRNYSQAATSMESFISSFKATEVKKQPQIPDAYYVAAQSRQALGQTKEALLLLENAIKTVPDERLDPFLYKLGELNLKENNRKEAREYFDRLVKNGKDEDWRRLARQTLQSIPSIENPPKSKTQ